MRKMYVLNTVLFGSIVAAPTIFAETIFSTLPEMIEKEWQSHSVLRSTRMLSEAINSGAPLRLGQGSPVDALRSYLRKQGLHPLLTLAAPQKIQEFGLARQSAVSVTNFTLKAGNYNVCKSSIRLIETQAGDSFVLGVAPNLSAVYAMTDDAWSSSVSAISLATDALAQAGLDLTTVQVTKLAKCVFPIDGELRAAWQIVLRTGSSPYQLFVGGNGIIEGDILSFDAADAKIRAYSSNPTSGTLTDFTIKVNGDGYLTNSYFTTLDAGTAAVGRVNSTTNTFTNAPGTSFFPEQSSFVHVNQHRDFAEANGYTWPVDPNWPKPLTVKNHVVFSSGKVNNAQYTPFDGTSGPFIQIGDGDGLVLTNLSVDSDVVSHEFGHHIVFGSITTTSGESLVLHEGLADSITFLRMEDSCLGESICPAASSLCAVAGKCLRTGTNVIKYGEKSFSDLKSAAHLQGQLVSGFFWDLHEGKNIPVASLNKLLISSITFLPAAAQIKDLVIAVLDADYVLFAKAYQPVILAAAEARGMSIASLGIDLSTIDGKKDSVAATAPAAAKSSSKKSILGLCSIGSGSGSTVSSLWIAIGLLLPVIVQILRRPRPVLVKVRKR